MSFEELQVIIFFLLGVAAPYGVYYAYRAFRQRR